MSSSILAGADRQPGKIPSQGPPSPTSTLPEPQWFEPSPQPTTAPDESPGSSGAPSPATPGGPLGHQFPGSQADRDLPYVSYRRPCLDPPLSPRSPTRPAQRRSGASWPGDSGFPERGDRDSVTSFTRSESDVSRESVTPLQFPPIPPDLQDVIYGARAIYPPPLTANAQRVAQRPLQSLQDVLDMPPIPPTPPPMPVLRQTPLAAQVPVYRPPPPQVQPPPPAKPIQMQPPSPAKFIAIGIDFGTTYSGVSWAFSATPDDVREIKHYPHLGHWGGQTDDMQVPTLYDGQNLRWGYQVAHTASTLKWFKLLLLRDEDIREDIRHSPYLRRLRQQLAGMDEDGVVGLVAAYLQQLWRHSLMEISMLVNGAYLATLPFHVALTVPAIWKPYARTLMLEAARRANITAVRDGDVADTKLVLVEEPEAAAVSTLLDRRELPDMAVGETCVVCDCGGGTIDIISYKLLSRKPFSLCEAAGGAGKLCGAFLVDEAFEKHVARQFKNIADIPPADYQRFLHDEWEHALKRNFSDADGMDEYRVHLPTRALSPMARLFLRDTLVLDKDTVRGFFHQTLQGIYALIDQQYEEVVRKERSPPKKIILVGGLGNSRYLYEQLQKKYKNVVKPDRCWSAVAAGAVIKVVKNIFNERDVAAAADADQHRALATMPTIEGRVARCSYGVQTGVPVSEANPPLQPGERIIDEPGSVPRVWRMQWYLRRGELMYNRRPVSYCFFEYVRRSTPPARKVEIYTSERLPPPRRKDASCRRLCTLSCAYDVPFESLPVVPGRPRLRVVENMRLTMRFEGQPEWRLQVGNRTVSEKLPVEFEG